MADDPTCGHAIRTDRYDDTLSACHLREGHEGNHTDGYYVWHVETVMASQSNPT